MHRARRRKRTLPNSRHSISCISHKEGSSSNAAGIIKLACTVVTHVQLIGKSRGLRLTLLGKHTVYFYCCITVHNLRKCTHVQLLAAALLREKDLDSPPSSRPIFHPQQHTPSPTRPGSLSFRSCFVVPFVSDIFHEKKHNNKQHSAGANNECNAADNCILLRD